MKICALILNYNDAETTLSCVMRLSSYDILDQVIVVDNCSSDDSIERLNQTINEKITVIRTEKNGGYGYGNNVGIKYLYQELHADYILLCNPDTRIEEKCIETLVDFLVNSREYVIAAPFMLNRELIKQYYTAFRVPGKIEYIFSLGMLISKFGKSFYYRGIEKEQFIVKDVGSVSGSLFMMNAELMMKYGLFDENIFLYCEEIVLGIKLQHAKKKLALLGNETFIHEHSISVSKAFQSKVKRRKLLLQSKLYVIKEYYKANPLEYLFAVVLAKISVVETAILAFFRKG